MDIDINNIAQKISSEGYTTIPNVFDQNTIENELYFLNHKFIKGGTKSISVFLKQILTKAIKFDFKKIKHSFDLKKISQNLNLKGISDQVLQSKSELHMIDSYYSERSNDDIITWHNDIGISEKILTLIKGENLSMRLQRQLLEVKKQVYHREV